MITLGQSSLQNHVIVIVMVSMRRNLLHPTILFGDVASLYLTVFEKDIPAH